jgi:PAS domain S-box-containing protein
VLIEANRAPLQAAGIAFEDVCGKRFEDCYWWSYSPAVQADLRAAIERAARGEAVRYDVDVRMAGGRLMTIDFMLAPLRDEAGQITHLIPSAVDITERKRAELRFRSLVEAVPIGVIRANVFGDILNANEAFLNLVGYTREDLEAGRLRWIDITPPELLPLDERAIAEARERGTCTPYEKTYRRKDGSLVPILIGYTLLGESREEAIAFILDLTEIKRAREALATALGEKEALLQQKETLLREVNHRVKNSLQLVSSLLLLQSRTVDDTAAQAQLTEAHNRVMTIAKIHEQLYTQSRTPDRIAFGPYLHALCGSVAGTAVQARERVRVAVEADAADLPTDEAVSLALIANELLTNAFKHAFTNSGSGTITVTFRVGSDGGRTLAVADDGCGLPTGADPVNGSGLGMRLIKALAGQLGGRLDAADAGHGARFTVALPARPA